MAVIDEVKAEREHQRTLWPTQHDDSHTDGSLKSAGLAIVTGRYDEFWPASWSSRWKKKDADYREKLIVGIALLIAEVERLDRIVEKYGSGTTAST